ncbi:MAG TPA: ABC transporter permease, partial [Aestuariivirga sp.]|nr:ABC transporter permease [Aestuariivirga sp.]
MIRDLFTFRGRASASAEVTLGVLTAVLVLLLWEAVARAGLVAPQFLPSPTKVVVALWTMLTQQHLLWHAGISSLRVWVAFLIAAAMSIPIGILM